MVRKRKTLREGDYVLATKYHDGDPGDHFAVGFFVGMCAQDRHLVQDGDGKLFRASGFRRCERISPELGERLVALFPEISDRDGPSLWSHRRRIAREIRHSKAQ